MDDDFFRRETEDEGDPPRPDPDDLDPTRISLRPVTEEHVGDLRWIHERPGVVRWWAEPDELFPWESPASTRLTIFVDGQVGGLIQYWEEENPRYRHAGIDLFVDPALHGKGIGTAALRKVIRHLFDSRGHHRLVIDPAADNAAAIRVYEKVGFKPVGITRSAERDLDGQGWHDSLLMDLLPADFRASDED